MERTARKICKWWLLGRNARAKDVEAGDSDEDFEADNISEDDTGGNPG
jgi:hypothetical protein